MRETDPIHLVKAAVNFKKKRDCRISLKKGDEIYCVYDVDDNTDADLENARILADKDGIKIYLSNPCFEIWFLLHFIEVNAAQDRHDLIEELKKYIRDYRKCKDVYPQLKYIQKNAITNARKLNQMHEENGISLSCRSCNPSTQVFQIVEHILSLGKD